MSEMSLTVDNCKIVYFNGLTVGSKRSGAFILKLTAKSDDGIFSVWIKLPKSCVVGRNVFGSGLHSHNQEFFIHGKQQPSVPLKTALLMFHAFLTTSREPVLLVGHSPYNIGTMLMTFIQKSALVDLFHGVIAAFANTFPIWKINLPNRRRTEDFTLLNLSRDILGKIYAAPLNDTIYDLLVLAELAMTISSKSQLIENSELYEVTFTRAMKTLKNIDVYRGLEPLLSAVPEEVLRKMAEAELSYITLRRVFQQKGTKGLEELLTEQLINKEPPVITDDNIVMNILGFFEKENPNRNADERLKIKQDAVTHEANSSSNKPTTSFAEPSISSGDPSSSFGEPILPFNELSSALNEQVLDVADLVDPDPVEQLRRDREFLQEWNQAFDPSY